MTQAELNNLLTELLQTWENEVVEFKSGGSGFLTDGEEPKILTFSFRFR